MLSDLNSDVLSGTFHLFWNLHHDIYYRHTFDIAGITIARPVYAVAVAVA